MEPRQEAAEQNEAPQQPADQSNTKDLVEKHKSNSERLPRREFSSPKGSQNEDKNKLLRKGTNTFWRRQNLENQKTFVQSMPDIRHFQPMHEMVPQNGHMGYYSPVIDGMNALHFNGPPMQFLNPYPQSQFMGMSPTMFTPMPASSPDLTPPFVLNPAGQMMPQSDLSHSMVDLNAQSNLLCPYHLQGHCAMGTACRLMHTPPQVPIHEAMQPAHAERGSNRVKGRVRSVPHLPHDGETLTSLNDCVGRILKLSKDQHGCRFLQGVIENGDEETVTKVFNEVIEDIHDLMSDTFGNYLCQKLIERCGKEQRLAIIDRTIPHIIDISNDIHGTRAVQKLIDFLGSPDQVQRVVNAIKPHVVDLVKNLNGNHVIQKCLNRLDSMSVQFIYDIMSDNCVEVATHRHGCCVFQRCIDYANDDQKQQLVKIVVKNAIILVKEPYANYVIQYVLELGLKETNNALFEKFVEEFSQLSVQKFASNVMEKCLNLANMEQKGVFTHALINSKNFDAILADRYGNYVIQSCFHSLDGEQVSQLIQAIVPHLPALQRTIQGKRIYNKIVKLFPESLSTTV